MQIYPYIKVARFDKPEPIFLILFPCYWGLAYGFKGVPPLYWLGLFALGAIFMRAAGCVFNDWVDQDLDAHVKRTKDRPFASKQLSTLQGIIFFGLLCLGGLGVLLQLPIRCWKASFIGFFFLLIYPFMKRFTYWPQAVLGAAYNSGLWVGSLVTSFLAPFDISCLSVLYLAGIMWSIGYDTIYAFQDVKDDIKVGIKSTAVRFKSYPVLFVFTIYSLCWVLFLSFGFLIRASGYYFSIIFFLGFLTFNALRIWDPQNEKACLNLFKQNKWIGFGVFIALILR